METLTATCTSTHCFCEAQHAIGLVQPINSYSSLAFVLAGIGGLILWRKTKAHHAILEADLIVIFSIVLMAVGMSSFYYHGTLSFVGQFLDIFSMYLFGTLLTVGALVRRGSLSHRQALGIFVAANIVLGMVQYFYPDARRFLFALLLLPGIILELLPGTIGTQWSFGKIKYLLIGIVLLATAYGIWLLDQNSILCWPGSLIQGHAIWHILGAVAGFMIILHYLRTTHPKK